MRVCAVSVVEVTFWTMSLSSKRLPWEPDRLKLASNVLLLLMMQGWKETGYSHPQLTGEWSKMQQAEKLKIRQGELQQLNRYLLWQLKWSRVKSLEAIEVSAVTSENIEALRCLLHHTLISGSCMERLALFQATREATSAESVLHQGSLGTLKKKRSSDKNCAEDKVDKEWWKIKD